MASKGSDLIALRYKIIGNKPVVTANEQVAKSVKGVGKATDSTARKSKYAERTTSRLTSTYKKLGSAAKWGLGFLGVGGVLAIQSSIHATEELSKTTTGLTRNLGLQTNVASRWGAVAQAREIDTKSLNMSFSTLSSRMVEAGRKGGTLLTPFHQLGISQSEVSKGADNFQWGLLRVAKALGEEEGGAVRSTAAKALLGRGYQTLLPLFSEGVVGLKEQLHWADEYGVTLSGHTNEAIMEMVQAQRENKVAMLGLQVSLTSALMPAIHAGDEQLQEFIATLNSPKLTEEQKISRISRQFLSLEGDIVKVIDKSLPTIAEHAGHLGAATAGAVWHGFIHSDTLGKLVIAAWVFRAFGGATLVKAGAFRVGGMIGTEMGVGLAAGATGAFIEYEIWQHLSVKTREGIHRWALNAGQNFVNTFVGIINLGIREINEGLNQANVLSVLGVDAPQIGEVGGVNLHSPMERQEEVVKSLPPGSVNGPGGSIIGPRGEQIRPPVAKSPSLHDKHRHPKVARAPRHRAPRRAEMMHMGGTGDRPIIININHKTELEGKVLAETVTRHALDAAALA